MKTGFKKDMYKRPTEKEATARQKAIQVDWNVQKEE